MSDLTEMQKFIVARFDSLSNGQKLSRANAVDKFVEGILDKNLNVFDTMNKYMVSECKINPVVVNDVFDDYYYVVGASPLEYNDNLEMTKNDLIDEMRKLKENQYKVGA